MTAHWGLKIRRPSRARDTEKWLAFRNAFASSKTASRSSRLPIRSLDRIKLQARLDAIGSAHSRSRLNCDAPWPRSSSAHCC